MVIQFTKAVKHYEAVVTQKIGVTAEAIKSATYEKIINQNITFHEDLLRQPPLPTPTTTLPPSTITTTTTTIAEPNLFDLNIWIQPLLTAVVVIIISLVVIFYLRRKFGKEKNDEDELFGSSTKSSPKTGSEPANGKGFMSKVKEFFGWHK